MRLHEFPDYKTYLDTQTRGSHYRAGRRPTANKVEIGRIVDCLEEHWKLLAQGGWHSPRRGLCHGARCGTEVKLFQELCPKLEEVVGTDLYARDQERVIEWDFHKQKDEWIGRFDFVYSNSFDHSDRPLECLKTWMAQLKPTGLLLLSWSFAHKLDDRPQLPYPGGDCFGASLHEYIDLCRQAGEVVDLLWCNAGAGQTIVVAKPKGK